MAVTGIVEQVHTITGAENGRVRRSKFESVHIRRWLWLLDLTLVVATWSVFAIAGADSREQPFSLILAIAAISACTIVALRHERLYQSRIASVRSEEIARLARACCFSGFVGWAATNMLDVSVDKAFLVAGSAAVFVLLTYGRGRFQSWIERQRAIGNYLRPIIIVGNARETMVVSNLFFDSPEHGYLPVGFVRLDDSDVASDVPQPSRADEVLRVVEQFGASGVVISTSTMPSWELNEMVRALLAAHIHVHLSSGISGLHHRRLRVQPIGHEPLIYVEPMRLSRVQVAAKRLIDIVGSLFGIVVLSPIFAAAAIAIKLNDRGPVVFRQERVGRERRPFVLFKLRTMCVNAEEQLASLASLNERQGPLFKLADDPRVTRVGRFLRARCLDELPQVFNVLSGKMSLVGPRPALSTEIEALDDRLLERLQMKPGLTGLWQVEARDKSSFGEYGRLDLFYVENWSAWLDLAILLRTGRAVWSRFRSAATVRKHPSLHRSTTDSPTDVDLAVFPIPSRGFSEG